MNKNLVGLLDVIAGTVMQMAESEQRGWLKRNPYRTELAKSLPKRKP